MDSPADMNSPAIWVEMAEDKLNNANQIFQIDLHDDAVLSGNLITHLTQFIRTATSYPCGTLTRCCFKTQDESCGTA